MVRLLIEGKIEKGQTLIEWQTGKGGLSILLDARSPGVCVIVGCGVQ